MLAKKIHPRQALKYADLSLVIFISINRNVEPMNNAYSKPQSVLCSLFTCIAITEHLTHISCS